MISVFLVRHADVDLPSSSPDSSLNAAGIARARSLAHVVGAAGVTAIFTSEFTRTRQTVVPLAARLGLQSKVAPASLIHDLLAGPDGAVVLIAGHSNTIPHMIGALGVVPPLPTIRERDFDNLFVVTVASEMGHVALARLKYGKESV